MQEADSRSGTARIRLRLLGVPALLVAGMPARPLSPNDAAMFVILAQRGPVPRAWLARLLWPDNDLAAALSALRQRVFKLGELAGGPLFDKGKSLALLPAIAHDLADPLAALRADPGALEEAMLGDQHHHERPELAAELDTERERWRQRKFAALGQLAAAGEAIGDIGAALPYARRLVDEDPLREEQVRLLMRLQYRLGDRSAALEAFDRCKRALYEELGEPPADETVALAQDIGRNVVRGAAPLAPVPLALRHPPRTIGREAVLAEAERRLESGAVVLLSGAAGIGKTRVFDELVQRWQAPIVCRLQADDATSDQALLGRLAGELLQHVAAAETSETATVLRWLAKRRDGPLAPPVGPMHHERLAAAIGDALACGRGEGRRLIAIDNLHFADADSAQVLARQLPGGNAGAFGPAWLLTSRSGELPSVLAHWLARRDDDDSPLIELPMLDAAQVGELIASMERLDLDPARWAGVLHAHCDGHPLSLLQVLRALHDRGALAAPAPPADLPIPREAMRRVARCLDHVSAHAQQLAFVAALSGSDFDVDLACALLGCSATQLLVPWRQLEALGVLRGGGFSHELLRQAVLEALPAALAPALHRDIAAQLRAAGRPVPRCIPHWEAAGEWQHLADDALRAAGESLAAGLQAKARDWLLRAAAAYQRADQADAAFDARWRAGRLTLAAVSATDALHEAAELLASAGDDRQRCLALCLLSAVHSDQHDQAGLNDARQAVALAERLGDPALLASAHLREAAALQVAGNHRHALDRLAALQARRDVFPRAERNDVDDLLMIVLAALGRRNEALALNRVALDGALRDHDFARAAEQAGNCGIQLGYLCQPEASLAAGEQAVALAQRAGVEHGYVLIDEMSILGSLIDLGHYDRALDIGERLVREMRAGGYVGWTLSAENSLAAMFMQLGRNDLAQQHLPDAPADAPTWGRAMRRVAQARLAQASGTSPQALLQDAMAIIERGGVLLNPYAQARVRLDMARWREPADAVAAAAELRRWAIANEHVAMARMAHWIEIESSLRAGDVQAAARCADALVAGAGWQWHAYACYMPEIWWALCRAWDGAGQTERADDVARHAAGWVRDKAANRLPPLFRGSFLERNAVNRALLARAVTVK